MHAKEMLRVSRAVKSALDGWTTCKLLSLSLGIHGSGNVTKYLLGSVVSIYMLQQQHVFKVKERLTE
jgi:hypothetical protein